MKLGLTPLACIAALAACSARAPSDLLPPPPPGAASSAAPSDATARSASGAPGPGADADDAGASASANDAAPSVIASDAEVPTSADANADASALESQYATLPIAGAADAPTVSAVSVRCAAARSDLDADPSDATYPGAFARVVGVTDPQGIGDLAFTTQELVLYAALDGSGAQAHTFTVNVYGNSFGGWELATYFAGNASVLAAMCARPWWPGEITVTDASGHVTRAKLRVPIVH